jgi:glycosyltransferase involved in cell wall biosynthesis
VREDEKFISIYKDIAFLHEPDIFPDLLAHLTRHDWGLVGNLHYSREWEVAFPNKLFEYIGACVPIVSINAKECSKFIEEYDIGITVKSMEELADRWREHRRCRNNLIKLRSKFFMEEHIQDLENLYQEVLCTSA